MGQKGQEETSGKTTGEDRRETGVCTSASICKAARPSMPCPPSPQPHTLPVICGCGRARRVWWASVGRWEWLGVMRLLKVCR